MYPFMTLNDDTEIVHSEMQPDGRVKVFYFWANEGEPLVLTSGFLSSGKYIISANVPT